MKKSFQKELLQRSYTKFFAGEFSVRDMDDEFKHLNKQEKV